MMISESEGRRQQDENRLVLSFLAVRRLIGTLGYFLPVILVAYALLGRDPLRPTISDYYYSPMREVFVGTLLAQAVFLWSYVGYREPGRVLTDKRVSRVAAVAVAAVALAPTTHKGSGSAMPADPNVVQLLLGNDTASLLHFIAAGVFFLALAVCSLVLFLRGRADDPQEIAERRIHRACGWTILAAIATIGLLGLTGGAERMAALRPIFWLETVATFAFATSWAVKGRSLQPLVRLAAPRH